MPEIIELTDLDEREELQLYTSLNEAQLLHYYEPNGGIFIAESPKVIERALDAGCQPVSFLMEKKHVQTQGREILERCPDVPVYVAKPDDSLWQIGKKYYMPVARIKELNGLTTDMLKGGEKLLLVKER